MPFAAAASEATMEKALSEWNALLDGRGLSTRPGGEEGEAPSDVKEWLSPSAYRARLGTFRAETYFAKPAEVSPLVCARFGWINSARDMLTCAHPSCRAAVCVAFHPVLGAASVQDLARKYRQMLATAHAPSCPFRSDAERWLLDEDTKGKAEGFTVPPYLIPMSDEFVLLEDVDVGGLVTRRLIRRAVVELSEQCAARKSPMSLSLPHEVKELFAKECPEFSASTTVENVGAWIVDVLRTELRTIEYLEQESLSVPKVLDGRFAGNDGHVPIDEGNFNDSSAPEISLLASFGWRVPSDPMSTSLEGLSVLQCRLCLACASVAASKDNNGDEDEVVAHQPPPAKKQRTDAAPSVPTIDLISCHRHFCPYRCGFKTSAKAGPGDATNVKRTTRPGWNMVLSMLIQHHRDKENGSEQSGREGGVGEKTFKSVRHMLRSVISPLPQGP